MNPFLDQATDRATLPEACLNKELPLWLDSLNRPISFLC